MYTLTPDELSRETLTIRGHRYEYHDGGGFGDLDGVHVLDCESGEQLVFGRRGGRWSNGRQVIGTCDQAAPPRTEARLRAWLRRQLSDD